MFPSVNESLSQPSTMSVTWLTPALPLVLPAQAASQLPLTRRETPNP